MQNEICLEVPKPGCGWMLLLCTVKWSTWKSYRKAIN